MNFRKTINTLSSLSYEDSCTLTDVLNLVENICEDIALPMNQLDIGDSTAAAQKIILLGNHLLKAAERQDLQFSSLADRTKLKNLKEEIFTALGSNQTMKQQILDLEKQKEEAVRAQAQFQSELSAARQETERLNSNIKNSSLLLEIQKENNGKLKNDMSKAQQSITGLAREQKKLEDQISQLNPDTIKIRMEELMQKKTGLENGLKELRTECDSIQEDIHKAAEENKKQISLRDSLRTKRNSEKFHNEKLLEEQKKLEAEIERLKMVSKSLESKNESIRSSCTELEEKRKSLTVRQEELKKEKTNLLEKTAKDEKQLTELQNWLKNPDFNGVNERQQSICRRLTLVKEANRQLQEELNGEFYTLTDDSAEDISGFQRSFTEQLDKIEQQLNSCQSTYLKLVKLVH